MSIFQMILLIFRFQESDLDDIHFDQQYVTTQATVVSYKKLYGLLLSNCSILLKIHEHRNRITDAIVFYRIAFRNVFQGRRVSIRSYEFETRQIQLAKIVLIRVRMIPMCIRLAQCLRILETGLQLKRVIL